MRKRSFNASKCGDVKSPTCPPVCASKAAVRFYAEALRPVLANEGIALNIICPGYVKTPMTDVNDFPMPFLIPADRAAAIIIRGLAKNRGRIAFPARAYFFAWLVAALPDSCAHIILKRTPAKKAAG